MTSLRWRERGWPKCNDSSDWLREWDSDKGGGGPKNRQILRTSCMAPYPFPRLLSFVSISAVICENRPPTLNLVELGSLKGMQNFLARVRKGNKYTGWPVTSNPIFCWHQFWKFPSLLGQYRVFEWNRDLVAWLGRWAGWGQLLLLGSIVLKWLKDAVASCRSAKPARGTPKFNATQYWNQGDWSPCRQEWYEISLMIMVLLTKVWPIINIDMSISFWQTESL